MNKLDALSMLIGAENHIFATTYNPDRIDEFTWETIDILRNCVNLVRFDIAESIGATLNYGQPQISASDS